MTDPAALARETRERLTAPGAPFEIATADVRGQQLPVFANRHRNLGDWLVEAADYGERDYLVQGGRRLSFAEHNDRVGALAVVLAHEYGVVPGERVAIVAANSPDWLIAFWAATALGAVVVAADAWWTAARAEGPGARGGCVRPGRARGQLPAHRGEHRGGGCRTGRPRGLPGFGRHADPDRRNRDPRRGPTTGRRSEIWLRSQFTMLNYWADPVATGEAITADGWLRTGDIGALRDGRLYLTTRRSDLILRGGENVYPAEVEAVLAEHPDVLECAVYGAQHDDLGQELEL